MEPAQFEHKISKNIDYEIVTAGIYELSEASMVRGWPLAPLSFLQAARSFDDRVST